MRRTIPMALLLGLIAPIVGSPGAEAAGTWTWPVRGPIVRPFDPPASPYGAGHRGIDIAVPAGTVVLAPAPGVVSFAGRVAGELFVSIDHGAGLVSTSSYLSAASVAKDDPVVAGQPIGLSGAGHPGSMIPHLHFGVRLGGVYVDPLRYLGPISLVGILWLAPIGGPDPASPGRRPAVAPGGRTAAVGWRGAGEPNLDGEPAGTLASADPPSPVRGRPVAA
jgi:hypothetical protein